jgi:hypothetical protein
MLPMKPRHFDQLVENSCFSDRLAASYCPAIAWISSRLVADLNCLLLPYVRTQGFGSTEAPERGPFPVTRDQVTPHEGAGVAGAG